MFKSRNIIITLAFSLMASFSTVGAAQAASFACGPGVSYTVVNGVASNGNSCTGALTFNIFKSR